MYLSIPKATEDKLTKALKDEIVGNNLHISISAQIRGETFWKLHSAEGIINYYIEIYQQLYDCDTDEELRIDIGTAICKVIHAESPRTGNLLNIHTIADAESGDLEKIITFLMDDNLVLKDEYLEFGTKILYIDNFELKPEFRGKGIGYVVLPMILEELCNEVGVITILPCPTENGQRLEEDDPRFKPMLEKMTNFLVDFGFEALSKEDRVWARTYVLD